MYKGIFFSYHSVQCCPVACRSYAHSGIFFFISVCESYVSVVFFPFDSAIYLFHFQLSIFSLSNPFSSATLGKSFFSCFSMSFGRTSPTKETPNLSLSCLFFFLQHMLEGRSGDLTPGWTHGCFSFGSLFLFGTEALCGVESHRLEDGLTDYLKQSGGGVGSGFLSSLCVLPLP